MRQKINPVRKSGEALSRCRLHDSNHLSKLAPISSTVFSDGVKKTNRLSDMVSVQAGRFFGVSRENKKQSRPVKTAGLSSKFAKREKDYPAKTESGLIMRFVTGRSGQGRGFTELNLLPKENSGRFPLWLPKNISARGLPSLAVFLGLLMLALSVFPLLQALEKNRQISSAVLGAATLGYGNLQSAQVAFGNSDLSGAQESLSGAYKNFQAAITDFNNLSGLAGFIPQAEQGKILLLTAREATLALQYAAAGMQGLSDLRIGGEGIVPAGDGEASELLASSLNNFRSALQYLQSASEGLAGLDIEAIPSDYREKIIAAKGALSNLVPGIRSLDGIIRTIIDFSTGEKTYLILFQNNRELRAAGGFIGTYGIMRLNSGRLTELKIESVYNPDGQLKEIIAAPGPLQRELTKTWAMRDSNWFFNFPSSAEKSSQFFEKETGRTVDGVIAFTPALFQKLLAITGPIYLSEYDQELNSENFVDVVQYETSVAYDRVLNQPKKFLADFAPLLLEKISQLTGDQWLDAFGAVLDSLQQKDTQIFSRDEKLQAFLTEMSWAGAVRQADSDYLAIVNSNVGAGKTDQDISQIAELKTQVLPDGSALNTLKVLRYLAPGKEKEHPTNVDFIRVFVPLGSRLISVSGFDNFPFYPSASSGAQTDPDLAVTDKNTVVDALSNTLIYSESGKTVFANWVMLRPGESREFTLQYLLPFRFDPGPDRLQKYSMLAQKQAGAPVVEFQHSLVLPGGVEVLWQNGTADNSGATLKFSAPLITDRLWGAVFK